MQPALPGLGRQRARRLKTITEKGKEGRREQDRNSWPWEVWKERGGVRADGVCACACACVDGVLGKETKGVIDTVSGTWKTDKQHILERVCVRTRVHV